MKKLTFFLSLFLLVLLIGCENEQMKIDKNDLIADFHFYNILPGSLRNHDYKMSQTDSERIKAKPLISPLYRRLVKNFDYTQELLIMYNDVLDVVILEDELVVGEIYQNADFEYSLTKDDDLFSLDVRNDVTDLTLHVKTNQDELYQGTYQYMGDDLNFTYTGNTLNLTYYDADEQSNSDIDVTVEGNQLLVKNNFSEGNLHYKLHSVSDDRLSAIYYDGDVKKQFVINDETGHVLYESLDTDSVAFSGFHLYALNNYTNINYIDEATYYVDSEKFNYEVGSSYLYQFELPYLSGPNEVANQIVYILGTQEFIQDFNNLPALRAPFGSEYMTDLERISNNLYEYWQEIE